MGIFVNLSLVDLHRHYEEWYALLVQPALDRESRVVVQHLCHYCVLGEYYLASEEYGIGIKVEYLFGKRGYLFSDVSSYGREPLSVKTLALHIIDVSVKLILHMVLKLLYLVSSLELSGIYYTCLYEIIVLKMIPEKAYDIE